MEDVNFEKGQHMLTDLKIVEKEISAAKLGRKDRVIEIGAGSGILTKELVKAERVLAFEIDEKFRDELEKLKKENKNLEIIYGDALKKNWKGYNKIVSNIPYFLAGDVVLKAVRDDIDVLVLVVGDIFKMKLDSKNGKIGIIANLFYDFNIIKRIYPESFLPSPKTDSWLIKLEKKKLNKADGILKSILSKDGKIKNAIMYSLVEEGKTKNQAREIIEKMNISKETQNKSVNMITGEFVLLLQEKLKELFIK